MGLFGFGKKKRQSEEAAEAAAEENDKADEAISETAEAPAGGIQETILPEPSDEYDGRGDEHGPWDVDDENVPDYDEYLDMGAYYLPFLQGIELRVKANRATQQVLGTTITYGSSSVEIEAFAAPKTMGLWDDVRADLVEANKDAKETDGVFGTELTLPVVVKGGTQGRHPHRRCGRTAVDAARHLLRQSRHRSGPRRNQGAEPAFLQHRRGTRRGPAGPA